MLRGDILKGIWKCCLPGKQKGSLYFLKGKRGSQIQRLSFHCMKKKSKMKIPGILWTSFYSEITFWKQSVSIGKCCPDWQGPCCLERATPCQKCMNDWLAHGSTLRGSFVFQNFRCFLFRNKPITISLHSIIFWNVFTYLFSFIILCKCNLPSRLWLALRNLAWSLI